MSGDLERYVILTNLQTKKSQETICDIELATLGVPTPKLPLESKTKPQSYLKISIPNKSASSKVTSITIQSPGVERCQTENSTLNSVLKSNESISGDDRLSDFSEISEFRDVDNLPEDVDVRTFPPHRV
ncbi:hypothetical protein YASMINEVIRUS_307 [Yasminevirus sp. GU-2018]|uniref:Uncharacterized protein n=1 Tax=Yasminevirus sp. GU-2018 TaxID=2420051 RepID=A0A5K0U8N5_9VIRU|nr:hypothetical protein YASMINEVIRUS_307 [Yasminevirus sp. GU-2018]